MAAPRPMRKSLSMPAAPAPARPRHRKSLHEDEHSQSFSFSFAKRRLERAASLVGAPRGAGVEVALLDRVQVEFVKAVVPASKMASTRYVMRVASAAMNQSWEMSRTFREFYELKEALVRALDHGHFCKSNCPWVYMYATHHFPRRHVFRSRSPSVISNRIGELQTFLSTVLGMWKENRSLDCAVSGARLPHLLYDFLFQGMVLDFGDIGNMAATANGPDRASLGGSSIGGSFLDNGGTRASDEECSICQRTLVTPDTSVAIAPPSSSNKENSTSSNTSLASSSEDTCESYSTAETARSSEQVMASLTTLQCGHCFHDECILAKLNESLVCPRCAEPAAH